MGVGGYLIPGPFSRDYGTSLAHCVQYSVYHKAVVVHACCS